MQPAAAQTSEISEFVVRLRQEMPALDRRVLLALAQEHPQTFEILDTDLVRAALATADANFLDGLEGDLGSAGRATAQVAAEVGVQAAQVGAPLDHITDGIRTYQRLSWEIAARLADELDLPGTVMTRVAETYIRFADDFSRAAVDGYVTVASQRKVAHLFARQQLVVALLTPPLDPAALEIKAAACDWPLPTGPVRIAVGRRDDVRWPLGVLTAEYAGRQVAVLTEALTVELPVSSGPPVPLGEARTSWSIARRLHERTPADNPVSWEDHLGVLAVTGDEVSAAALCRRVLAPLDGAPERQRQWLGPTLQAWLDHQGSSRRLAETLHLHEQSARYRVQQMRQAFGEVLDTPRGRLELRLALLIRDTGIGLPES